MTTIAICRKKVTVRVNRTRNQITKILITVICIAEYQEVINTRVIGFTFLNDFIHFPKDPYGKFGPSLTDILNGKEK